MDDAIIDDENTEEETKPEETDTGEKGADGDEDTKDVK